jgi:hypothetical protein
MFNSIKRALQKPNPHPLGSQLNPIRCVGVMGEQAYLRRLRDLWGRGITYDRMGGFGNSPDGHIMDGYKVVDSQGNEAQIFMDMYDRRHIETKAPDGFYISNWSVGSFKETQGIEWDGKALGEILRGRVEVDKCTEILMFCIVWGNENGNSTTDELEVAVVRNYKLDSATAKTICGFLAGY